MPATVASDTDSAAIDTSYDSQAPSDSDTSPGIFFFAFVGAYRVCFFALSFCFRSPPASYLDGMYMDYQASAFYEISKPKVD